MLKLPWMLPLFFSALFTEIACKPRKSSADLTSIPGSTGEYFDTSLYVLDERQYRDGNTETLIVRRYDCGGEERLLKGRVEEFADKCLEVKATSVRELVELQYIPMFQDRSGTSRISSQEKQFLLYLLKSLRVFPNRDTPLRLNMPVLSPEPVDLAAFEPVYSELFATYMTKLADFMAYESQNAQPLRVNVPQVIPQNTAQWSVTTMSLANVGLGSASTIQLNGTCGIVLSGVHAASRDGRWSAIPVSSSAVNAAGYQTRYRLSASALSFQPQYLRLVWRLLDTSREPCSLTFVGGGGQNPEDTPTTQPGARNLSRAERFHQLSERFGSIGHRLHHMLWHSIRNGWNRPGTRDADRRAMVRVIPGQDWLPPRPVVYGADGVVNPAMTELHSPGAGEDFLHMHHAMLNIARSILGSELKAIPSIQILKEQREILIQEGLAQRIPIASNDIFQQQIADLEKKDLELDAFSKLETTSLSALGTQIEWTVHNALHERFSRPAAEILLLGANNPWTRRNFFAAEMPWNQQSYQHLSDPYAAATNPVFWLIHAYVDQWIDRWAKLHNIDEVSDDCGERLRCHQWLKTKSVQRKPWDGGTDVDHAHEIKVANLPPDLARSLINMGTFVTR